MVIKPGPDSEAAYIIRMKLERNELPAEVAERIWAGYGTGETCSGCGLPIEKEEVEYELTFAKPGVAPPEPVRLHRACCELWNVERVALFAMDGSAFLRARNFR